MDHIGLWFFFCGCAGVSIIVWIFNWVCWLNQCCCCDFLHNPVNKRIAWWMSFSFLLGVLACCISAFVTVNRFGFALEGAWCAVDRIYYDSFYGQLKDSNHKWKGIDKTLSIFENIIELCDAINYKSNSFCSSIAEQEKEHKQLMISLCQLTLSCDSIIDGSKETKTDIKNRIKGEIKNILDDDL